MDQDHHHELLLARCYLETLLSRGEETQLRNGYKTCSGVPSCPVQLSTNGITLWPQFASIATLMPRTATKTALRAKLSIQKWAKLLWEWCNFVICSAGSWQQVQLRAAVKLDGYAKAVWWWFKPQSWPRKHNLALGQLTSLFLPPLHLLWHFLLCIYLLSSTEI